jgi:hypothetical protein
MILNKLIMKTNKTIILLLALVASISFTSCVEDGDFTVPQSIGAEENAAVETIEAELADPNSGLTEISIANLAGLVVNGQATEITSNIVVKGYVTSSDETGNFYKEFFIQDKPENPTAAIKVALELVDSYNKFNIGREVYVRLNGLYVGEVRSGDGVATIGGDKNDDGDEVENLSLNQLETQLFRSSNTETIVPLSVKFSEINDSHIGMFIQVDNAQFPTTLAGKTYVDANDQFDTQRTLQSCDGFGFTTFILETSAFASFKFATLPAGGGSIAGVVSKTFNGSDLVLALNSNADVDMSGSRCTPLDINDFSVIVEEDFDSGVDNSTFNFPGWTNFAEEGSELWTEQVFSGNGYAEFSSFRSGDDVNIAWLISPGIDMDAQTNEFLNFQVAQHHLDSVDNTLELFVSTDYDGSNVAAATWQPVSANLPVPSDSWYAFKDSGLVDLSTYTGTLYVGFKVTGSGNDDTLDGAYMIDDFKVLAQ